MTPKKRLLPPCRRLSVRLSPHHYARAQEAAIRAGFKNLQSYVKAMVWKLTNEVKDDPPELRR